MNTNPPAPLLTIGILSWNRLHYLRATLESARRCIQYPNIQWIVLDNCSTEPGLADYLKSVSWLDELIFLKSDHVSAMNEIVSRARGEVLLLWPDDMQFIVEGDWMTDYIAMLMDNPWIGSMSLNCQRRQTIQRNWGAQSFPHIREILSEIKWFGTSFRFPRMIHCSSGLSARTYGWKEDGIIGSGIPSLSRLNVWKTMGPWKTKSGPERIVDSSGGGETEMLQRWRNSRSAWQRALPTLPVSADILTDPTGTKAKVRGNTRYGVYIQPPAGGDFYYQIYAQENLAGQIQSSLPIPFEDFVKPLGFELPLDKQGNLLKTGINLSEKSALDE